MQTDQEKEIERLRRENAALRAGAIATDPPLTFKHKPLSMGGAGVLGAYGLWKDSRSLQLYPNQMRRLRRDIDRGMQYIVDHENDLGWDINQPDQKEHFMAFVDYLKKEGLFRIH